MIVTLRLTAVVACASAAIVLSGMASAGEPRASRKIVRQVEDLCAEDVPGRPSPDWTIAHQKRVDAFNTEEGRRALLEIARSSKPSRGCELQMLSMFGDERAVPLWKTILMDTGDPPQLRRTAILYLTKNQAALPTIIGLVELHDKDLRGSALDALAPWDDERVREFLRARLARGDAGVITAIAGQRDAKAIPLLVEAFEKGDTAERMSATRTLIDIGTPESRAAGRRTYSRLDWTAKEAMRFHVMDSLRRQRYNNQDPAEVAEIDAMLADLEREEAASKAATAAPRSTAPAAATPTATPTTTPTR